MQSLFSIVPLDLHEWKAVVAISFPVIFIDEALKFIERVAFTPKPQVIGSEGKPKTE